MINRPNTNAQRLKRHKRVRGKISGTPERPRLNVFRSETNIYAQIIDDVNGHTLAAASSLEKDFAVRRRQEGRCQAGRPEGRGTCQGKGHRDRRVRPWWLYLSWPCPGSGRGRP